MDVCCRSSLPGGDMEVLHCQATDSHDASHQHSGAFLQRSASFCSWSKVRPRGVDVERFDQVATSQHPANSLLLMKLESQDICCMACMLFPLEILQQVAHDICHRVENTASHELIEQRKAKSELFGRQTLFQMK